MRHDGPAGRDPDRTILAVVMTSGLSFIAVSLYLLFSGIAR